MKIEIKQTASFLIELSHDEAVILKAMVQNPQCDDEPEEISTFRRKIFEALRINGDQYYVTN